jgi:hypothetical protein
MDLLVTPGKLFIAASFFIEQYSRPIREEAMSKEDYFDVVKNDQILVF